MFLLSDDRILVKHVVEVGEVRQSNLILFQCSEHPPGPDLIEWLPQVERVGHGIEQSFSRNITFGWMKRGSNCVTAIAFAPIKPSSVSSTGENAVKLANSSRG